MRNPFKVTVYDGDFGVRGRTDRKLLSLEATPRFMGMDTATLTLDADAPRIPDLMTPGARIVIDYDGKFMMSGPVRLTGADGPSWLGTRTFEVHGDFRLFSNVLGWQNATGTLAQQNVREYDVVTGPAETVVKTLVQRNAVSRLGMPVIIAPDQGRGETITVATRMHPLADTVLRAAELAGIGLTVRQHPTLPGLLVDAFVPTTYPRTLTERSGVVTRWRHSTAAPTVTRVVLAGPGDGTDRIYRSAIDAAREAEWHDIIEVARDARDVAADAPELEETMAARGAETLAEGAATAGLALDLAETDVFRYGRAGLVVGARAPFEIGHGITVTDVIRSARVSWSAGASGGLRITPQVGERTDDPNVLLAQAIRATAAATRRAAANR